MSWEEYKNVMEHYAIKTDDMATEDAYFIATHMPFSQLEVYLGGRTSTAPQLFSEKEVFENLICNPNNEHRMIIVRGDNGTGKSHLIRFLKAKLENSPVTVHNPETEQLIFLRRLNNSVRGAFSQLIEQKVIKDPEIEEKLKKFIASSDSKDEKSFKIDILFSYVAAVQNDLSGEVYKPVVCRDIASYLSDSRVKDFLLRDGGAISRCYSLITSPSDQVLKETTIFNEDDFNDSKIIRAVIKQADPQASDFATTLKGDAYEINRLVNYLNRFTREVVQRCADISSESTKSVFVQLRKDLKKQNKNLTIFIEDFTGFTGIDSELITVLSTEHGGDYSDLCRVTAVIGITNDYYDQFRDNFTDRVTHQISVTDRSYGTDDFLVQMAGRYLNSIFCNPEELRDWNKYGAKSFDFPVSDFKAPCEWDSIIIEGKELTLYPFNRHALLCLYESLPVKNPRMFLRDVIRAQLKEYFDGKIYKDEWYFPMNPANVQMSRDSHSSAIDRLENLSLNDKKRLKSVFALWGDGSASGVKESDGTILFGGLDKEFLADIGLMSFSGIGEITDKSSGQTVTSRDHNLPEDSILEKAEQPDVEFSRTKPRIDAATRNYQKFKNDIAAWFTKNETLKFDSDYRQWLRNLIKGDSRQVGAINWQDLGIPAYIAEERLSDLACYYIEEQSVPANDERIIVYMEKSTESRDALFALNEYYYANGWEFEEAVYYQQRLITWLERRKHKIIEKVTSTKLSESSLPILEWCLAVQYIKACILGHKIDFKNSYSIINSLFIDFKKDVKIIRDTEEWNNLIQFTQNRNADFVSTYNLLKRASATTMGAVYFSAETNANSFYRANELILAVKKLESSGWDVEADLPEALPKNNLLYNPASLLKTLYTNVRKAMAAETEHAFMVISKLSDYIGELSHGNLVKTFAAIQNMFVVFAANSIPFSSEMKAKYDTPPIESANEIVKHVDVLQKASSASPIKQLTAYSGNSLNVISVLLKDLQKLAQMADQEKRKAQEYIERAEDFSRIEQISKPAMTSLKALSELVENLEVSENAVN